jgi:hypothetical protein
MHAEKPVTIPMIGLVRLAIQNAIPVIKKVIGSRFALCTRPRPEAEVKYAQYEGFESG